MKTLTLKPQHETTVIGRMIALKSSIDYISKSVMPLSYQMEAFEVKEYQNILNSEMDELTEAKLYITDKFHVSTFNALLSEYGLSVAVFIHKFIN